MSETTLRECGGCHRHVREAERACPFCDAPSASRVDPQRLSTSTRVALAAALAMASGVSLGACYGGPPHPQPYRPPPPNQERPASPAQPTGQAQQPLEPVPGPASTPR